MAKCDLCGGEADEKLDFCFGCSSMVCIECDPVGQLIYAHDKEQHKFCPTCGAERVKTGSANKEGGKDDD